MLSQQPQYIFHFFLKQNYFNILRIFLNEILNLCFNRSIVARDILAFFFPKRSTSEGRRPISSANRLMSLGVCARATLARNNMIIFEEGKRYLGYREWESDIIFHVKSPIYQIYQQTKLGRRQKSRFCELKNRLLFAVWVLPLYRREPSPGVWGVEETSSKLFSCSPHSTWNSRV